MSKRSEAKKAEARAKSDAALKAAAEAWNRKSNAQKKADRAWGDGKSR